MLENLKAIIFDLDDTLYSQKSFKLSGCKVVAEWLEKNEQYDRNKSYDELLKIIDRYGPSYPFIFDRLIENLQLEKKLLPMLIDQFINHPPTISLYDNVDTLFFEINKKYLTGLLTDGRHQVQKRKVLSLNLADKFDHIVYSDFFGLSKPAVELYVIFEKEFNLTGDELMYVGDNPGKDFSGAVERGWKTIRVLSGEFKNAPLSPPLTTDLEIDTVSELSAILP